MANEHKIAYTVKMMSHFTEPYSYGEDISNIVQHKTYDEYVVYDAKTFHDVLDEFLDAPKNKLTTEDVHKDFDSPPVHIVPDEKVEAIKTYYNGRFDLSKKIYGEIDRIDVEAIDELHPIILKFKIPFHLNYFSIESNDPYDAAIKLNDASIEIEIAKVQQ